MLRSLLNLAVFAALTIAILVGLFIAWWIAVCAVLGFAAWLWLKRLMGGTGATGAAVGENQSVVIEGQYRVEPETVERIAAQPVAEATIDSPDKGSGRPTY